jgi:hypothetical protein
MGIARTVPQRVLLDYLTNLPASCNVHLMDRLHGPAHQSQHKMQSALLRNLIVGESRVVFELLALEYQAHHGGGNPFLVLYATFDDLYRIVLVTTQRDGFAVESPHEDRVHAISVGWPRSREPFVESCWARSVWDDLDLDSTCSLDSGYLSLD